MSLSAQATLAKTFVNAVPRSFGAVAAAPSSARALNILKHSSNDDDDHKRNDDKKWSQLRAYSTTRVIPSGNAFPLKLYDISSLRFQAQLSNLPNSSDSTQRKWRLHKSLTFPHTKRHLPQLRMKTEERCITS